MVTGCAAGGAASRSGDAAPNADADNAPTVQRRPAHEAEVAFMNGMIAHHRQALAMTAMVADRTDTEAIHLLAERIEVSQQDEIAQMSSWLENRGLPVPAVSAAHAHDHSAPMPGMLSPEEMARLEAAAGAAFDRLFLELMIRHHEGALSMVGQLLSTSGAAQDVDVFRIASEVDSDQRIEIERMRRMLGTMG
jgi:uncharacterized protein (DUF305 family)